MFTVRPILSIVCAIAFSTVLTNSCEAGKWVSAQSVKSIIQNPNGRFYAKIYGQTYSGPTPQIGNDREYAQTGGVPNDPYPGITTYYHVLAPVTIIGNYQAVLGQIFYDADSDPNTPDELKGLLDFTQTQY